MSDPVVTLSESARPRRGFLTVRVRTLIGMVAAVALGIAGCQYYARWLAVRDLVNCLKVRVFVSIGPTSPYHNPVHDASGLYAPAIREVRHLHAESMAARALAGELRRARVMGDETRMRGALAAIQDLGPERVAAGAEVERTALGEGLPKMPTGEPWLARGLAIHILAKIATDDPSRLRTLIHLIEEEDPSPGSHIRVSAANELAPFHERGMPALPALLRLIADRRNLDFNGGGGAYIGAIGALGPGAREALPALKDVARDRSVPGAIRRAAVNSVASILIARSKSGEGVFPPDLLAFLGEFSDEPDIDVVQAVESYTLQAKLQAEARRRREEMRRLIAADRTLGGRPRPPVSPSF